EFEQLLKPPSQLGTSGGVLVHGDPVRESLDEGGTDRTRLDLCCGVRDPAGHGGPVGLGRLPVDLVDVVPVSGASAEDGQARQAVAHLCVTRTLRPAAPARREAALEFGDELLSAIYRLRVGAGGAREIPRALCLLDDFDPARLGAGTIAKGRARR